jgi:hypothetical protein
MLHLGRLWPDSQTITRLERLAKEKHSNSLQTFTTHSRKKVHNIASWGLYHKTLPICNLRKIDRFRGKLVLFLLSLSVAWTNTIAYQGICTLRIRNIFILQVPVAVVTSSATSRSQSYKNFYGCNLRIFIIRGLP